MPCTLTNLMTYRLNIPYVDDIMEPNETKTYEYVEHDVMANDSRVMDLVGTKKVFMHPGPGDDFSSAWDADNPLRMEPYQMWVDASDDLRMINGVPMSDTDGFAVGGNSYPLRAVQSQTVSTAGRTFASIRSSFLGGWRDQNMATWDDYWKYCLWSFAPSTGSLTPLEWTTPTRFATESDMFDYMEANLPTSGTSYTQTTKFRIYDEVDEAAPYPRQMVHRNSLVASMSGRRRWSRKGGTWYGVSSNFNAPAYYTNFYGELGQRFVEEATATLPPTNNDGCIWYPRASRNLWHWPPVGSGIQLNYTGQRGAVWDTVTSDWVAPAPPGFYTVQNPWMLYEYKRNRVLALETATGTDLRLFELNAVAAKVFPVVFSGRYWAFVIYPHGADTFSTEWHDTAEYAVTLKLRYSGTYQHRYVGINPWPTTVGSTVERMLWSHFDPTGSGSLLIRKHPGQYKSDVDTNVVPTKVYMSRRNIVTGRRSRWVPIYQIKRRLNNASFRIEPAT